MKEDEENKPSLWTRINHGLGLALSVLMLVLAYSHLYTAWFDPLSAVNATTLAVYSVIISMSWLANWVNDGIILKLKVEYNDLVDESNRLVSKLQVRIASLQARHPQKDEG